jgi:hypothetical protein
MKYITLGTAALPYMHADILMYFLQTAAHAMCHYLLSPLIREHIVKVSLLDILNDNISMDNCAHHM